MQKPDRDAVRSYSGGTGRNGKERILTEESVQRFLNDLKAVARSRLMS